jgi:hypothetical protein
MREGNFLEFMPLHSSNLITSGDGEWKEHIVPIRTNDLGWFLGVDYHKYHIAQLNDLVTKTDSLILKQVTERWQYYLDEYLAKKNPIVEPKRNSSHELKNYTIKSNLKYYKEYELKNAIDGDPSSNYAASLENIKLPHILEIDLKDKKTVDKVQLTWESNINNPLKFKIMVYDENKVIFTRNIMNKSQYNDIDIHAQGNKVKIIIDEYNGQKRLLLRAVRFFGKEEI